MPNVDLDDPALDDYPARTGNAILEHDIVTSEAGQVLAGACLAGFIELIASRTLC